MSEYRFPDIVPLKPDMLRSGVFLWIWHANKIPPHLGLSVDGAYFSLKHNGKDLYLPYSKALRVIDQRGIATIVLKVNFEFSLDRVHSIFERYEVASSNGATCLFPLRDALANEECETLFDLLEFLHRNKLVTQIYGIHIPSDFVGIPFYGIQDIKNRLLTLQHASLGKNISKVG